MTADFWGLKSAGGTATAYHLLAAALSSDVNNQVSSHRGAAYVSGGLSGKPYINAYQPLTDVTDD